MKSYMSCWKLSNDIFNRVMKNQIKGWLSFNDNELGTLQFFAKDYVMRNGIDKDKAFCLGILSTV